jgi:hypothetical protein
LIVNKLLSSLLFLKKRARASALFEKFSEKERREKGKREEEIKREDKESAREENVYEREVGTKRQQKWKTN